MGQVAEGLEQIQKTQATTAEVVTAGKAEREAAQARAAAAERQATEARRRAERRATTANERLDWF